jgi:acyl-CoA thioester hydrolase
VDRAATAGGADRPDDAAAGGDGHGDAADDRPGTRVLDTGPGSGTNTYIARQEIEYLEAVPYSLEPLPVQLWISHLGGASIDICYEIAGRTGPAVRAMTTLVLVDEASGRPRRMSEAERASWLEFVDEPLVFRRRRGE